MPKMPAWLSVEEALAKVLSYVNTLPAQERPLLEALGHVLADDVRAAMDVPPAPNSSMDGYATQAASIRRASPAAPVQLRVIGEVAAGAVPETPVGPGTAVRIMTGALVPPGADTIIPFEETDELERIRRGQRRSGEIKVLAPLPSGANIRPPGEDIRKGALVLQRGTVLQPAHIGVLASFGRSTVRVVPRPVVAVLATGDELVEPPGPLPPGKIFNSNSYSIAASVTKYGGIPKVLGIARDTLDSLEIKIQEGLHADMLVTTAGVSRGDYDIVKDVLMKKGEIAFWTVRMRPAKPLAFGAIRAAGPDQTTRLVPHLGLPGNPVSAMVAFETFGRPAILKMMGRRDFSRRIVRAVLEDDIENTDGRRVYARAIVTERDGACYARLTGPQGSGVLTSMAKANALAVCPEDTPIKRAGETVDAILLD